MKISHVFGIVQGVVLGGILIAVVLRIRLDRDRNSKPGMSSDEADAVVRKLFFQTKPIDPNHQDNQQGQPLQIESALPSWNLSTPAHLVLGISQQASKNEIEKAYKKLLKQYHPDRFPGRDAEFQRRCHALIFILQRSRDAMLSQARQ